MRNITLLICVALIVLHIIGLPESYGFSKESEQYTRLTYLFVHGGWLHLLINIYSLLTLAFLCNVKVWQFFVSLFVGVTMPAFTIIPMVGISTVIYTITGMIIVESKEWWWLAVFNLLIIGAGMFMPGIAFLAHLYCFLVGMIIGFLTSKKYGREIA